MEIRVRHALVAVAAAAVVAAPLPALAEEPVSAEVQHVPAALAGDLSSTEEHALSDLTAGDGVPLSAFVQTARGPQVVSFDAGSKADATAAVSLLDAQPSVEAADVAVKMRPTAGAYVQYGNEMVRSEQARTLVGAALSDVTVAVLDTGVGPNSELTSALLPGQNFTDSPGGTTDTTDRFGHGTHVAGIIGADAGSNVEGVAAGVRILPVKVMADGGYGFSDWIAGGIVWAADHGADVINMSLGGGDADTVMSSAIDYARSKGVTVVAAAGNDDSDEAFYPADYDGVIAVAAVDQQEAKASFSNYGPAIDVAAPGVDIVSTLPGDTFGTLSGTSMASPHVAALAALAEAAAPNLTPDQVELAIEGTATDLGAPGRDDIYGRGLVDAVRTVQLATTLGQTGQWPGNSMPVAPDRTVSSGYTPDHLTIDVLSGASDPDGDSLTLHGFTQGARGTVTRAGTRLLYRPTQNGPYTDSFTYTVDDGWGGEATGTVRLSIGGPDPADHAPVARPDRWLLGYQQTLLPLEVVGGSDSDPDGDPLRVVSVTQPAHGRTAVIDGLVTYTAPQGLWGTALDVFHYTITDGRGRFTTGTVTIDIRHPNAAPVARDDTVRIAVGTAYVNISPMANDTDESDDHDGFWSFDQGGHGTVTQVSDTVLRYTPDVDLPVGTTDSFTYTIGDWYGGSATATVHVVIQRPAAPAAPTLTAVTAGNGAVGVHWAAPADTGTAPVTRYLVRAYYGSTLVKNVAASASARSLGLTGLANGRSYRVTVLAVNAVGTGPDAALSAAVTPRTIPGAPRMGRASAGHGSVVVRWAAPTSNGGAAVSSYVVRTYRGSALVRSTTVSARSTALTVTALAPGVAYTFRVYAVNAAGGSPASAAVTVRPAR